MTTIEKITDHIGTYWIVTKATIGEPNRVWYCSSELEAQYLASIH